MRTCEIGTIVIIPALQMRVQGHRKCMKLAQSDTAKWLSWDLACLDWIQRQCSTYHALLHLPVCGWLNDGGKKKSEILSQEKIRKGVFFFFFFGGNGVLAFMEIFSLG
jgi:hypothetical protein